MCSDMKISWEPNATYPVGLYGVIPGGTAWEIPVEKTRTRLTSNWTVNIQDGTRFILLMGDAGPYGTGGSTIPLTVQYSTDKSCINATSPKSTTSLPPHPSTSATSSPSSSPSSIPSSSASSSPTKSKSSSPVGAIVGGVIGGIAALALLALLLFCCRRRKKAESSSKHEEPASRQGLLGLRAPVPGRFSGHSRNSNGTDLRPRSWEIDAAGGSPDGLSDMGHDRDHSRAPEVLSLDPYPYTPPTTNRDSMFSSATEDSSSAWASTAGQHPPPQRTPKEVPVGVALSSRGTSTRHPSISSPMVAARPAPSVGNLSELNAVETGTPGQVLVDRDDLIAML